MTTSSPEFAIIEHPAERTAVVRAHVPVAQLPAFFNQTLPRVLAALDAQHLVPRGEPFAYYHGVPNGTVDVETGFPVHGLFETSGDITTSKLPDCRVVTGIHRGPYEMLAQTHARLTKWAVTHGLTLGDGMWEVYLTDPERQPDPAAWETRVFVKVEQ